MSKHLQKLFALVLICCAFLGSSNAWGQVFTENFEYPAGEELKNHGWLVTGNPATPTIKLSNSGLSYANSPVSAIGNGVSLTASGEDLNKPLGSTFSSGSVYVSFLVNISAAQAAGDYFLHLGPNPISSSYFGRVFVKSSADGVQFGVSKVSTPAAVYGTGSYSLNQTHLLLLKYTFNGSSTTDDVVELFVNPTLGATEPTAYVSAAIGGTDATALGSVALRQGNSSNAATLTVDGLQVGTTWASVASGTAPTTTPTITPSTGSLDLGDKVIGATAKGSYTLSAENLPAGENIVVTASGSFTISTSESDTYTSTLTIPASELATPKTIYVQVTPTAIGELTGEITHEATGATTAKVGLVVYGSSPYAQNFNRCSNDLTGGWSQFSVTGAQTWACTTFGQQGNGVQMSGHDGSKSNTNTDWLISPKMDFSGFAIPLVNVNYRTKYAGDALKIMVSTNYTGAGDPAAATWAELASLPADEADVWKLLENLGLQDYKTANTYLAFVYTSTDQSAARWTLDNFEVKDVNNYLNTSALTLNFPETAAGSASVAKEFTFSAVGFTNDVVVAVPANFEVSKDGTTYATSLTYTAAAAAATNKVYVRFAPATTALLSTGPVTFTSGETSITRGSLSGSSLLKANTLEVVSWNLEWFGSVSNGPDDEQLQYDNAKKAITALNADIIGVQEIVDDAKMQQLATETGYTYITKVMSWQGATEQKVGFLYKQGVVTVKKDKVLLAKLFADVKANTTSLSGYPTNDDLFWASGRLPYLVEFEATINGVKQSLHVVNLHAKANGETNTVDYERRKYDGKVLSDSLAAQYGNANLILLGDFNDDVDVSVVGTNQKSSFDIFVADTENYKTLTYDLSTAGKNTYESGSLKSFLDHIFISNDLYDEYVANSVAIEENLLNVIPNFRANTSDHLPVSARFILTASPASIAFTQPSISKTEDAGSFTVSLIVSQAVATPQTVTVTPASSSTATAADYTLTGATNGAVTVTIPANATSATFEVNITNDTETEGAEQVVFNITGASNGLEIGSAKTFTLTIEANDAPTGIADGTKGQFSVYPTVANDGNVRLLLPERIATTAKVNMVVYSAEGRKVLSTTGTQDAVQANLNSKIAALPSGIYMILIETGKEYFQTKMVKN